MADKDCMSEKKKIENDLIEKSIAEKKDFLFLEEAVAKRIDEQFPPEEELEELADFFKMFGDVTRLKILSSLEAGEMCVQDLSTVVGMSQSAVSHQLRVLKQMDLVKNKRVGKTIFYALADDHILTILKTGLDHMEEEE